MRIPSEVAGALLALAAACCAGQAHSPQDPTSAFGFTFRLPEDWKVIEPKGPSPEQQKKEEQKTSIGEQKRGIACLEVPLTARHGEPPTIVVIDALPFDCYGQKMTRGDLQAFGAGAGEGLKQTFDITSPITATYEMAGHNFWIERARAIPKGKQLPMETLEVVCTLLRRAAVCWVVRAADEGALKTFEQMAVTLDGNPSSFLVPDKVFENNH
jgi:hypothetical protein